MGRHETMPHQSQAHQPGRETEMHPRPEYKARYPGARRLEGKVAIVTGGDSGIGRAVVVLFAREGADVAIVYLEESEDAAETAAAVREEGRKCLTIAGDIASEEFCRTAVEQTVAHFGRLDILVNNAAEQHEQLSIADVDARQLLRTFQTNVFGYFFMTKAVLPHLPQRSAIVNTTSVTAYKGSPHLLDYSATRGAVVAFTRSLAQQLVDKGIRVNGVAPGPIWDAADSGQLRCRTRGAARRQRAHGAAGATERGRILPPVPGLRRLFLHDRPDPAPERRHHRRELTP